jgi:hypothetical protein
MPSHARRRGVFPLARISPPRSPGAASAAAFGNGAFTMTDESTPLGLAERAAAPRGAFAAHCLSFRLSAV